VVKPQTNNYLIKNTESSKKTPLNILRSSNNVTSNNNVIKNNIGLDKKSPSTIINPNHAVISNKPANNSDKVKASKEILAKDNSGIVNLKK
jgi:hypothetical protein